MRHTISSERKSLKQYIIWPFMLFGLALRGEGLENILYIVTLFWIDVVKITLVGILDPLICFLSL